MSYIVKKILKLSPITLTASCLIGSALSTLLPSPVRAQVALAPMVIESQAQQGESEGIINVTNSSDRPFRARIYAQPFTYNRDTGFQTVQSSPNDLTPYLQFSPRELNIPPGVTRRVRLISRLAPNIPDGEYRSVIFTEELNQKTDSSNTTRVRIQTRIGTIFYVRKGNVSPKLAVDSARFDAKQNQIQLLVRNTGNASALTSVSWTLKQGDKVVKNGERDPMTVIAQADRNFLLPYPGKQQAPLAAGTYQLTGELVWQEDNKQGKLPFSVNLTVPATSANLGF